MPQQDDDAPQLHEAEVVLGPSLVADHQAPEVVVKPGEEPLDLRALLLVVAPELAPVLRLFLPAASPVRGDHLDALLSEGHIKKRL